MVGNTDDARTGTFYSIGNISHNWPSWNQIAIKVDNYIKTFDTAAQTINGRPAYFFLWNELTQDLWCRQNEREKLLRWIETASLQDFIGMAELIVEQTESEYRVCKYPGIERLNLRPIQIEIYKRSLPALRRLNGLIEVETVLAPSTSSMAA